MNRFSNFLRRLFGRRKPPSVEYVCEASLPADAAELERIGVIEAWRTEAATGLRWFKSEPGAVRWFEENLMGGRGDV